MSDEKLEQNGLSRRSFLGTAAASGAGIAGAGLLGLAGCSNGEGDKAAASGAAPAEKAAAHSAEPGKQTSEVGPGELDQYYGFLSGGQSGEMRLIGVPSMRELMRIPVFNMDSATGWGRTNESLRILNEKLRRKPVNSCKTAVCAATLTATCTTRTCLLPIRLTTVAMHMPTIKQTPVFAVSAWM